MAAAAQAPPRAEHAWSRSCRLCEMGKNRTRFHARGSPQQRNIWPRCWNTIPHVTQHDRANITELEQLRARFAPKAEQAGGKMTVTAIALKVCAAALKVFPQFNASIDMEKKLFTNSTSILGLRRIRIADCWFR